MKLRITIWVLLIVSSFGFGQKAWEKDLAIADAYYEKHAYQKAADYYELVAQRKKSQGVYQKLGEVYFQLRAFDRATYYWEKAVAYPSAGDSLKFRTSEDIFLPR